MPYVACPTCGERGKIPPTLVGPDQVQEVRQQLQRCTGGAERRPSAAWPSARTRLRGVLTRGLPSRGSTRRPGPSRATSRETCSGPRSSRQPRRCGNQPRV